MIINQINVNKIYNIKPINPSVLKPLKSDIVSFGGLLEYAQNNPNIIEAVEFGYELYNNSSTPPEAIIKKYANDVKIVDYKGTKSTEEAYFDFNFNKNFKAENLTIYSHVKPKTFLKQHKMSYALALAHEYTHYKRATSPLENQFIKNLANSDFDYLTALVPFGDLVFYYLEMEKFGFTKKIFNCVDLFNEMIFSEPIPRKKTFKREDILLSQNMKTQKQFQKYILNVFDKAFEDTLALIKSHDKDVDPVIIKKIEKMISQNGGQEKLKNDVRKYCMYCASNEKEAHATECMLARKILNTNHQINYDSYVIYYSMLEKALR